MRSSHEGLVAVALSLAFAGAACAQSSSAELEGVTVDALVQALATECYEAGMATELLNGAILVCSTVLEERSSGTVTPGEPDPGATVLTHKLRFTPIERGDRVWVGADAWIEVAELGTVVEQPISTDEYLARVDAVLADVGKRLQGANESTESPAWKGRYADQREWELDAHLRAVALCDARLRELDANALGAQLRSAGIYPLEDDTRGRCEQLYQHLFQWGLARGITEPTVEQYQRFRESLPPGERPCSGRLALTFTCT
jgi:hypothetical protein